MRSSSLAETRPPRRATRHWTGASLGWVLEPWGRQFLAQPSKVLSTGASRARVTPVEGERDKPTLVGARHLGGRKLTGRRGFSCQQAKVAPATPMEGKKRQAPGEDEPGTRFFGGLFGGQQQHCGSCCFNSQPFSNNNNGFNGNFQNQNQGFNNQNQGFNNQNQGFNNQNQAL